MSSEKEQAVSVAVGQFSDNQKRELNILGGVIFTELNLNKENPQDLVDLRTVLLDCIARGLKLTGKIWFSEKESIVNAYTAGLSERQRIANQLQELEGGIDLANFATQEEIDRVRTLLAGRALALSPNITAAEEVLEIIFKRRAAVNKLHSELFSHSNLAMEATVLKQEVGDAKGLDTKDRLFINFLAFLALYKKPGLDIEPKDLVALSELWQNTTARNTNQLALVTAVREIASNLGIAEEPIELYTWRMLDVVSNELQTVSDIEMLPSSLFIISDSLITSEQAEFETQTQVGIVDLPLTEVESARNKYLEYKNKLTEYLGPIFRQEDIADEYGDSFVEYLESINALDFVFILKDIFREGGFMFEGFRVKPETEFDSISILTYINALNLLNSNLRITETGKAINDLQNSGVILQITNFLQRFINEHIFKPATEWEEVLPKIPVSNINTILSAVLPTALTKEQLDTVLNLDLNLWHQICLQAGVEYNPSKTNAEDGSKVYQTFSFSPDSVGLVPYIALLPEEKMGQLASKLRREIKLD